MADLLLVERDAGVLVLTLNRPETLNALVPELFAALAGQLEAAARDRTIGAVVLTGAGRGFCSGGDRKRKAEDLARDALLPVDQRVRPQSFEATVDEVRRWTRAVELLHTMPKPTIAMINGACAGAGLSLAGACDLRFAAESAVFNSVFASVGLAGDFGGSWFWTRILGAARARELYLMSEKMNAAEARAFGLVNRVFADADLRQETMAIARRLAARAPTVAAYIKDNLNAALEVSLPRLLDIETRNMILSGRSWLREEALAIEPAMPAKDSKTS